MKPEPYYADEAVTLFCADSIEMIRDWNGPNVDLLLTDPPYCSGANEAARRSKRASTTPESTSERPIIAMDDMGMLGYQWTTRQWFMAARRITNPGGHLACFTDWRMAPHVQLMAEAAGWRLTNLVVWDKGYPGLGSGFRAQHEFIIIASNGEPEWHSYDHGNVLRSMRITKGQHPHEKPLDILRRIIETCCPRGGTVLDLFAGSGSTLRAARDVDRQSIGIELSPAYCEVAARRFDQDSLDFGAVS